MYRILDDGVERDTTPKEAADVETRKNAPIAVPESISALDGLLTLDKAGLSSKYETWANSSDRTFSEKAFINKAMNWRRDDPTLNAATQAFGLTSSEVDALFVSAASP